MYLDCANSQVLLFKHFALRRSTVCKLVTKKIYVVGKCIIKKACLRLVKFWVERQRCIVLVRAVSKMPPANRSTLKTTKKSPAEQLCQSIRDLLLESGRFSVEVVEQLIQEVPRKWERHEDLIVIPQRSLRDEAWKLFGK